MSRLRKVLLLSLWSVLVVAPNLLSHGTNVVAQIYSKSSLLYWSGLSPYVAAGIDGEFLYSPFFAAAYGAFAVLPPVPQAFAWAVLNCLVFWAGVTAWTRFDKSTPWPVWIALVLCSMELDGQLRYQQANALMTGLILLGVAAYRDGRLAQAGFWLALGTNVKLLPAVFAGCLLWPVQRRYVAALAGTLLLLAFLPSLFSGEPGFGGTLDQLRALSSALPQRKLDLGTVFERMGWSWGSAASLVIAGVSAALLALQRVRPHTTPAWELWLTLGLAALLLLNPKTESPTFVLIAPAYLFLFASSDVWVRWGAGFAAFLVSFQYNSLCPAFLWWGIREKYSAKTLGVLLIWTLAATLLVRLWSPQRTRRLMEARSW